MKRAGCPNVLNVSAGWRGELIFVRCGNPRPWWRRLLGMTCVQCEARR